MLPIVGCQKTSLIDYPERLSSLFFTAGCNFHCPYCHNPQLVSQSSLAAEQQLSPLDPDMIWRHLEQRKNLIDGIVITGGEPTLHGVFLEEFIRQAKAQGFLIKLDTNGTNPVLLTRLIADDLLDYVAMDLKTSLVEYPKFMNQPNQLTLIEESIDLLKSSANLKLIDLEFRTTLHPLLHTEHIFREMLNMITNAPLYVLQTFRNTLTLNPQYMRSHAFTDQEMQYFLQIAQKQVKVSFIR